MYIITSSPKVENDVKGNYLGVSDRRALYYSKFVGTGRIYRNSYPLPDDPSLKLFKFHSKAHAKEMCDTINSAYNDDFEIEEIQ